MRQKKKLRNRHRQKLRNKEKKLRNNNDDGGNNNDGGDNGGNPPSPPSPPDTNSLLKGHRCRLCSYVDRGQAKRYTAKDIVDMVQKTHGGVVLNPEEYETISERNLSFICPYCHETFTTSLANYLKHDKITCNACGQKESVGERKIRQYLENHQISYEQEKRFETCKDKRPLPFDFYLPQYRMCIEFDGRHHYEPMFSEEQYYDSVEHDHIKDEWCKQSDIELLRIPYWQGTQIDTILDNKLQVKYKI